MLQQVYEPVQNVHVPLASRNNRNLSPKKDVFDEIPEIQIQTSKLPPRYITPNAVIDRNNDVYLQQQRFQHNTAAQQKIFTNGQQRIYDTMSQQTEIQGSEVDEHSLGHTPVPNRNNECMLDVCEGRTMFNSSIPIQNSVTPQYRDYMGPLEKCVSQNVDDFEQESEYYGKPLPPIPPYFFSTINKLQGTSNFPAWQSEFELKCIISAIPRSNWKNALLLSISDELLSFVRVAIKRPQDPTVTYSRIINLLKGRIQGFIPLVSHKAKYMDVSQQPREDIVAFAARLQEAAQQSSFSENTVGELLVFQFIKGVRSSALRNKLNNMFLNNSDVSLESLIQRSLQYEI